MIVYPFVDAPSAGYVLGNRDSPSITSLIACAPARIFAALGASWDPSHIMLMSLIKQHNSLINNTITFHAS